MAWRKHDTSTRKEPVIRQIIRRNDLGTPCVFAIETIWDLITEKIERELDDGRDKVEPDVTDWIESFEEETCLDRDTLRKLLEFMQVHTALKFEDLGDQWRIRDDSVMNQIRRYVADRLRKRKKAQAEQEPTLFNRPKGKEVPPATEPEAPPSADTSASAHPDVVEPSKTDGDQLGRGNSVTVTHPPQKHPHREDISSPEARQGDAKQSEAKQGETSAAILKMPPQEPPAIDDLEDRSMAWAQEWFTHRGSPRPSTLWQKMRILLQEGVPREAMIEAAKDYTDTRHPYAILDELLEKHVQARKRPQPRQNRPPIGITPEEQHKIHAAPPLSEESTKLADQIIDRFRTTGKPKETSSDPKTDEKDDSDSESDQESTEPQKEPSSVTTGDKQDPNESPAPSERDVTAETPK